MSSKFLPLSISTYMAFASSLSTLNEGSKTTLSEPLGGEAFWLFELESTEATLTTLREEPALPLAADAAGDLRVPTLLPVRVPTTWPGVVLFRSAEAAPGREVPDKTSCALDPVVAAPAIIIVAVFVVGSVAGRVTLSRSLSLARSLGALSEPFVLKRSFLMLIRAQQGISTPQKNNANSLSSLRQRLGSRAIFPIGKVGKGREK